MAGGPRPLAEARERFERALREALPDDLKGEPFQVDVPPDPSHGDLATNAALVLARRVRKPPRQLAEELVAALPEDPLLAHVEVAGPGFINLRLPRAWWDQVVAAARHPLWGEGAPAQPERIVVEFVSANPTGPLNVVNARAAVLGDVLCRLLTAQGHRVVREYYVNDAGTQYEKFKASVAARYAHQYQGKDLVIPEGGYPGEYVADLVDRAVARLGGPEKVAAMDPEEREEAMGRLCVEMNIEAARETLESFGVAFDYFARESELRERGAADQVFRILVEKGYTYEEDGAVWLRTTLFGDEKDRVIRRRDGEYTYILPDLAYHLDKFTRGDRLIDILGPDHHGYLARLRAGLAALGKDPERIEILISQVVHLVKGGQRARMSKRQGQLVTLEDFLKEVDRDAARFFFASRAPESPMDFDIDLANLQTQENPVYYVQYAHARIQSLLQRAKELGREPLSSEVLLAPRQETLYPHPSERLLLMHLGRFPDEVDQAATQRAPHRLTVYARELASLFHTFYTDCRVLGETEEVEAARLALAEAAGHTLRKVLHLLGVTAPDRM
ncbi:MAG: arginine--tRNA ligase [Clostridiales bacterium]|nr:arginine--tRNA ligase [Clostridiales bacterium]